jgi:phosphohistidine phosphatase
MKKLIIVRHSRAEDQTPEITDFERSLNGKGKLLARQMANKLKEKEKSPGLIITSTAFRALETAIIFAGEFRIEPEKIKMNSKMYFRMSSYVLDEIFSDTHNDIDTITIFGHNPAFSDIVNSMSIGGSESMQKCAVACISFNVARWSDIGNQKGTLEYYLKP